jgi:hypothetical protein
MSAALTSCARPAVVAGPVSTFTQLLEGGLTATYTAEYSTPDGVPVLHVQAPPWQAYRSMYGSYLLSPEAAYLCQGSARCVRAPGEDSLPIRHAQVISALVTAGLPTPELAGSLVARAAAQPTAHVSTSTRQVAGVPARCIEVTGPAPVRACATETGILAQFNGAELTRYSPTAVPGDLAPPSTASDVDELSTELP